MAKAADLTIVEAENIVPVGSINPNDVDLPGIFVNRIVPATAPKNIEIKKLRSTDEEGSAKSTKDAALVQRNRIAKRAAKELKQGYYVNLGVGEFTEMCPKKTLKSCALTHYLIRNPYSGSILLAGGRQGLGPVRERPFGNGKLIADMWLCPMGD